MKKWYLSKTLWANAVAILAIVLQQYKGYEVLDYEAQGMILGAINVGLRFFTKEGIE